MVTVRINPALESQFKSFFSDRDATIAADFDNEDEADERVCAHFPSRREANAYRPRRSLKGTITDGDGKFAFADSGREQMPTVRTSQHGGSNNAQIFSR